MILNLFGGLKRLLSLGESYGSFPPRKYMHKTIQVKGPVTPLELSTFGIQKSMDAKLRSPNAMPVSRMGTANEGIRYMDATHS